MAVAAAAQIGIVVATQVASHEPSAVARLYYADRLFSLPLGFVAAAAGTVFLPELARLLRSGDTAAAVEAQNRAMEWALLLAVPATLALAVLAEPIVSVLFERAAFGRQDTVVTAACLGALAFGLPAAAVARIQSQAFFAREDVRRPLAAALGGVVATMAIAVLLEPRFGAVGVAWAVTAGSWVGAVLLAATATRRGVHADWARLGARVARIVAAALAMAAVVGSLAHSAAPSLDASAPTLLRAAVLAALCTTGLAVFGLAALLTGALDRRDLPRLR
jgi:putative peptidoglycan lipid II flippase